MGDTTLEVDWVDPSDNGDAITAYDGQAATDASFSNVVATVTDSATKPMLFTGLTNTVQHYMRVRAQNVTGGEAPWSNTATGTPTAAVPIPSQIIDLTGTAGDQEVILMWSPRPEIITHLLTRYREVGAPTWTDSNPATFPAILGGVRHVTGLTNGTDYEFQVAGRNSAGDGPWSDSFTATPTDPSSSTVVVDLTVHSINPTTNVLTWTNPASNGNATSIFFRRPPGNDVPVTPVPTSGSDVFNLSHNNGEERSYQVFVTGDLGTVASHVVTHTTGQTTPSVGTTGGGLQTSGPDPDGPTPTVGDGSVFTGTFPGAHTRPVGSTSTPVLVPGGSTNVVSGVGTFTAVSGGIQFAPVEGFARNVVVTQDYTIDGGSQLGMDFEFDPFYWDGPLARGAAPTADATTAPAGLQAAVDAASAGDVIHVTDGTTTSKPNINKAVTVWAVNKHGAVFSNGFNARDGATVDGLSVTGGSNSSTDAVFCTGANTTLRHVRIATDENSARYNLLVNGTVSNFLAESCEFVKPDGSNLDADAGPAGDALGDSSERNVVVQSTTGGQVTGVTFRNCLHSGGMQRNLNFEGDSGVYTTDILVEHCWIEKSRRQGVYAQDCRNIRYINNRVFNVGEAGLQWNEGFVDVGGVGEVSYNTVWSSDPNRSDRMIDPINLYRSGGRGPSNMVRYYHNRTWETGNSAAASGGMMCDTGGGYVDRSYNVIVNTGSVGLGIAGGGGCIERRNKIFGRNAARDHAVGCYVWQQTSVGHLDTINGITFGWGGHTHDTNKIDFIRNVGVGAGTQVTHWFPQETAPRGHTFTVQGDSSNIYGPAAGLSADIINQF